METIWTASSHKHIAVATTVTMTVTSNNHSLSRRYVVWHVNAGNLNNQLISAAAAFDTAKMLNRTVFVFDELRVMRTTRHFTSFVKAFMGIEHGMWDLGVLREVYDVEFESDAVRIYGTLDAHPVLGPYFFGVSKNASTVEFKATDHNCVLPGGIENGTIALARMNLACRVIDIGGHYSNIMIQAYRREHNFFNVFRPGAVIVSAAEAWMQKQDWGTTSGAPALTVHSRSFWEGVSGCKALAMCQTWHKEGLVRRKLYFTLPGTHALHHETAALMCYPTPAAINVVLRRSGINTTLTNCSNNSDSCHPWFLASDGSTDGAIERVAVEFGARLYAHNPHHSMLALSHKIRGHLVSNMVDKLVPKYVDLYILSKGDVFLGNIMSTFSANVCKMRPPDASSNICGAYVGTPGLFLHSLVTHSLPENHSRVLFGSELECNTTTLPKSPLNLSTIYLIADLPPVEQHSLNAVKSIMQNWMCVCLIRSRGAFVVFLWNGRRSGLGRRRRLAGIRLWVGNGRCYRLDVFRG